MISVQTREFKKKKKTHKSNALVIDFRILELLFGNFSNPNTGMGKSIMFYMSAFEL